MITKDLHTYGMIFLRQELSLRDHGGGPRRWPGDAAQPGRVEAEHGTVQDDDLVM
jgi:hypothetical protein